jgi:hypothetical protein
MDIKARAMKCMQESLCFVSLKLLDHQASTIIFHSGAGVSVGVNNEYVHIKTKKD